MKGWGRGGVEGVGGGEGLEAANDQSWRMRASVANGSITGGHFEIRQLNIYMLRLHMLYVHIQCTVGFHKRTNQR